MAYLYGVHIAYEKFISGYFQLTSTHTSPA